MTFRRLRAPLLAALMLIVAAALVIGLSASRPRKAAAITPRPNRPVMLLLTSLPLMFGEDFSLASAGSPALKALQTRFRVVPISVSSPDDLARGGLLVLAHPRAQPAEDLVALDAWVRAGGRVLLFADPMLEWPSRRPLGDPLRPAPMFMDTGLLAHWGLRLDAPDERGIARRKLGGFEVLTASPGALFGACDISADRLAATCRVGQGKATIIADADLLDPVRLGRGAERNMDAVLAELARLQAK